MRYRFVLFPVGITSKVLTSWIVDFIAVPSKNCVVIMCSSVHHRVVWCQVRAIDTFIVRIEGKLKNLHSWEASAFTKFDDFVCHEAKVLSDDVQITEFFLHCCKEFVARTFNPFTRCCSFRTSRDFPV